MKQILTITFFAFFSSFGLTAQDGSIKGLITTSNGNKPLKNVKILFYRDSILVDSAISDIDGNYNVKKLHAANYNLLVFKKGYHQKQINNIVIQEKQTGRFNLSLLKGDLVMESNCITLNGVSHPNGTGNVSINELLLPPRELEFLSCVEVISYKHSLIDKDGGASGGTVRANEISRMPGRNAASIATTVGGVQSNADGEIISIRGSRSDANAYYVDGLRVNSLDGIPKMAINSVATYIGGLPANYGDVTGGVVSITTKSAISHSYSYPVDYSRVYESDDYSFNTEAYEMYYENEFLTPENAPLSTFSIDVDKASYSNVRRILNGGNLPGPGAIRIEELVNYFDYQYPATATVSEPVSIHTELGVCPWNEAHKLLKIGMKGYEIPMDNVKPSNLVFLIDVSGSMSSENKLPLLKKAMQLLVKNLRAHDKISIVVYAGSSGMVLKPTKGDNKNVILSSLDQLESGGSTNGGQGIELAYKLASEQFIKEGNNRVILATDGDFNIGTTSNDQLEELIESKRKTGIYLTTLGFGMGNYKDDKMEMLADKGNGNYFYIDNVLEAKKVLVTELFGTLYTVAKDVKIQAEFNPLKVKSYRLVGYENRLLAAQDFNNDTKDAGELGSGHTVTVLYELIPITSKEKIPGENVDALRYQNITPSKHSDSNELVQVKCRYKLPESDTSTLKVFCVNDVLNEPSNDFNFAASVAAYGMLLRNSAFTGTATYENVLELAQKGLGEDPYGYRHEFLSLTKTARVLSSLSGNK